MGAGKVSNNVIPFRGGMGGVRGGQDHMQHSAQSTSALQDGDSNPVVNQLQDIKEISQKFNNTVTIAGLTGVDIIPQPPDESV